MNVLTKVIRVVLMVGSTMLLSTCSQNDLFTPTPAKLENTTPVMRSLLRGMEGIYKLSSGNTGLGSEFVCKTSLNKVSFFSNTRGIFFILDAGMNPADSSLSFAGFWRVSENTSTGAIAFKIPKAQGSSSLLKQKVITGLKMTGTFTADQNKENIELEYVRDFSAAAKGKPLTIFGHHGIQTTANPPFIENSLNVFRQAQDYGANAVEVDVRLTKDNIPVLLHDPDINTRVTQKSGIVGDLDKLTYNVIYNFVRLVDGQRIPKVEDALNVAIDSTELDQIWLDVKGNPDVFKYLEPVVRNAQARAKAKGRNIEIITDLPSQAVIDEYLKQPSYADLPTMCELTLEQTISLKCKYWGPRWTEGTLNDDVSKAHQLGMKAYSWTLNSETFVVSFLKNGNFDGFITDYPAYAIYHYYTQP